MEPSDITGAEQQWFGGAPPPPTDAELANSIRPRGRGRWILALALGAVAFALLVAALLRTNLPLWTAPGPTDVTHERSTPP